MSRQLAKILCDSIDPVTAVRLTTMEVIIPRIVLAEFNTHRALSRNSASSRAVPIEKMLRRVKDDPYIPETWGRNGRGMQAKEVLDAQRSKAAEAVWLKARDEAVFMVERLLNIGVHKQTTNRLLEPWMWHTVIVSATEWSNFFHLRCHEDAHPAIRNTAEAMWEAHSTSVPKELDEGEWHLPLVRDKDREEASSMEELAKLSTARCARVSYLTHDGERDLIADIQLHDRLLKAGHMSPFEHPAFISGKLSLSSNFAYPWVQYRKTIAYEHDIHSDPTRLNI